MTWLVLTKEILELIGALSVCIVIAAKCFEFCFKLYRLVMEHKLELIRKRRNGQLNEQEKVFYERDE